MDNPNRPDPNRTHTEAVERVAEAIWRSQLGDSPGDHEWLNLPLWMQDDYRKLARAAIEAHTAALGLDRLELARKAFVDLTEAWAELRMDTEKDQALHDRLVGISRDCARLVPSWVAVPDSGGEQ